MSGLWSDRKKLRQHPTCMSEFLAIASSIFSEQVLEKLASRANHFDAVSGFSAVSDTFISSRPAVNAIQDIIWAIVEHSAAESSNLSATASGTEVTQRQQQPEEVDISCPIQQIDLEGPTIAEAWRANATTNDMENLALSVGSGADPSTMAFRALPVYHATDWMVEENESARPDPQRGRLRPSTGRNQVVPNQGPLGVVWTGFSPLICFLWAAFKAEVLHQIPTGTFKSKLERSWNCLPSTSTPGSSASSHTHSGITLFKFRPSLPSAFDQTHYVMPKGREAEWAHICRIYDAGGLTPASWEATALLKYLWDLFSAVHGGVLDTWPNVLHCHEFGPPLDTLRSYTTQLWRTVWFGAGVNALNNSHEVTYAVSFKLERPEPPKASSGKEEN